MIRLPYYLLLVMLLGGCPPAGQQLHVQTVEAAIVSNNAMVYAVTTLQEKAKLRRKAAMIQIANTVRSMDEGTAKLDEVEGLYSDIFIALREAEGIQSALADGLELAKLAVNGGERPDMPTLIALYLQLQKVYASVLASLGEMP